VLKSATVPSNIGFAPDPKLLGEAEGVDWDGQTGSTYFSDIIFDEHLYLSADSGLINAGKDLNN